MLLKLIQRHLTDGFDRILVIFFVVTVVGFGLYHFNIVNSLKTQISQNINSSSDLTKQLAAVKKELDELKNQDQVKVNQDLKKEINNIETTYNKAVSIYEELVDLRLRIKSTADYDTQFAKALKLLADKNFASATTELSDLDSKIKQQNDKIAAASVQTTQAKSAPVSNSPPGSGFSAQTVHADTGDFLVDIVSADLNSTKVIVDTASDSDCRDNCPVLPLAEYVSRNGAFAGINGSFFCPGDYPSCAGKTNTFDTLLMNKNKHYFNSDNNVYSTVPAAIFSAGSARFVGQSLEWGRDTGVDSVIANYPLYIAGGNINFGGNGDAKIDNKGTRSFVANKGSTVYIGIIFNASGSNAAHVLKTLGMDGALGLDQGGSTALWSGGYKAGPGRSLPNAILFVKR